MGKWNLDILYKGFDTEEYANDYKRLETLIPALGELAENAKSMASDKLLTEYVKLNEEISELVRSALGY